MLSTSLQLAAGLLSDFGLSSATLTTGTVLIPIAYYVHRRGLTQKYRESVSDAPDRNYLRLWTLKSLIIPGIWGSGLDSLLRDLRQIIQEHGAQEFPSAAIERRMAARGKSLVVTPEQVEDILQLGYGSSRTFAVLAVLFPHVSTRNTHHIDHVFPQALLSTSRLKEQGLEKHAIDHLQAMRDKLPNLQLLEGPENIAKSATSPAKWAHDSFPSLDAFHAYLARNELPSLPTGIDEFESFIESRRAALAKRIISTLGASEPSARSGQAADPGLGASIDDVLADSTTED